MLSSFLDLLHKFMFIYLPTLRQMVELIIVMAREANGQPLWFTILLKWVNGNYLSEKNNFRREWKRIANLYVMYCLECLYENRNKDTKRKGGTTDNRFQLSQQILYMKEEDLPLVKDIVDFSVSLVIKCNSRKFSEQWVNDVHKEVENSNHAPGVGGVSALVFIQLAATCGLINPVYALWVKLLRVVRMVHTVI